MRVTATKEEIQSAYEEEYLPLLQQDREKREQQERERKKAARKRKKQKEDIKLKEKLKQQKEKEAHEKMMTERRAEKRRRRKEAKQVKVIPKPQPPTIPEEEEEVEVIEEEDPFLRQAMIEYAKREEPILGKKKRVSRWGPPVTPAEPPKRRSRWGRPVKPPKKKKMTLAEFVQKEDKYPECKTVFRFFSKSKDAKPGEGKEEKRETGHRFGRLARVKDWRKKLSNFWKAPFTLDGKRWQTVEHYIESRKFDDFPKFAYQFSIDSDSELSKNPIMAKFAGSRSGIFKKKRIRPVNIKMKRDFYNKKNLYRVVILSTYAKFSQNEHLNILLDDTENACLFNTIDGQRKPHLRGNRAVWLETTRKCLRMLKEKGWEPMPIMPTPFISAEGIQIVKELVVNLNFEACGHLLENKENAELQVYISVYGTSIGERGTCQHTEYTKYIFHTHPRKLIAYPSAEDVVTILKEHPGVGALYPVTSVIFTSWGIWEVSSAQKYRLDQNWLKFLHESVNAAAPGLFNITEEGLVLNEKREKFVDEYIANVLDSINGNQRSDFHLRMSFTPWRKIKKGSEYYLRLT